MTVSNGPSPELDEQANNHRANDGVEQNSPDGCVKACIAYVWRGVVSNFNNEQTYLTTSDHGEAKKPCGRNGL